MGQTEKEKQFRETVSDLIFDAAISKAIEDNRELLAPSIEHFIKGGRVNGQFDIALKRLMRWVEKKVIEVATQDLLKYGEWARVNGERHRGNLQKNGMELYNQFKKEEDEKREFDRKDGEWRKENWNKPVK